MEVDSLTENRQRLIQFLNGEMVSLNGILRVYLQRARLDCDEDSTSELLNSVVVEALTHAQRYDPTRPPRAWLLGIAANLVRRRQAEMTHRNQREPLAGDLVNEREDNLSEEELFERLTGYSAANRGPEAHREMETRDRLASTLALLPAGERSVIQLFARDSLDGDALASALQVSPGAARVRLHRALTHLRRLWLFTEEKKAHD